jgi:ABC-type transport system involved in multi-copper enzyme maturation permease subunit
MTAVLAYADNSDSTLSNLQTVVYAVFIVLATVVVALIPIFISRARRHRKSESILVAVFFWACITAGSAIYTQQSQMNWSRKYLTRVESGYYDPNNTTDAPKLPWLLWSSLAAAYAGILSWSVFGKRLTSPPRHE